MNLLFLQVFIAAFIVFVVQTQEPVDDFGEAEEDEVVTYDPIITLTQGDNETLVKSEMQFLYVVCNVKNYKKDLYHIKWLTEKGKLVGLNRIFYIKSLLKDKDEGKYKCEITRKRDKMIFTKVLDLQIKEPTINVTIHKDEVLKIGGRVIRKCSDLHLPKITIVDTLFHEWVNKDKKVVSKSSILDIPIKDETVAGTYECRYKSTVTSKVYKVQSKVTLSRSERSAELYKIELIQEPKEFAYKNPFALKCVVTDYTGLATYRWFKNGEFITTNQTIKYESFDENTFALYRCEATLHLPAGKRVLKTESLQQLVILRESKIELTEKPGPTVYVHSGEKKELHCEIETASKFKGSDARWFIKRKEFLKGSIKNVKRLDRQLVSMLVISDITMDNAGKYECHVGNEIKEVNINVLLPTGIIETNPPLLQVKEGEPVEFHCRIDNIPNVKNTDLKWKFRSKDGKVEYDVPDKRWEKVDSEVAEYTSFINLESATMPDNGYLICSEPGGLTAQSELIVTTTGRGRSAKNKITITPETTSVRPFQRIEIQCFSQTASGQPSGTPHFYFENKTKVDTDPRFNVTTISPSRIQLTIADGLPVTNNDLKIVCSSAGMEANATIFIKQACETGYRYCRNGKCLENSKFCDGTRDCADGSDENEEYCSACDPVSKPCINVKGKEPRKKFYLVNWACDGDDDCGNDFDEMEENCDRTMLNECGGKYFTCQDGKKIPKGFQCDKTTDCANGEDESGCTAPQVVNMSDPTVLVKMSENVSISCEVFGTPLPVIVWRFNWKCIPSDGRFTTFTSISNCTTISSTLTIANIKQGDDGIYNCEALSERQRVISPDFRIMFN